MFRKISFVVMGAAALALSACGGGAGDEAESGPPPFTASVVNSNLGVGVNRVMIGLVNREDGTLVSEAAIEARLYEPGEEAFGDPRYDGEGRAVDFTARTLDINDEHAHTAVPGITTRTRYVSTVPPTAESSVHRAHEGALVTVYTAVLDFDRSGYWGLELDVRTDGRLYRGVRVRFAVLDRTSEPGVGEPALPSRQLTIRDVADVSEVSSAAQPVREMLDQTLAEALATGKPVVIAFATPAFCQTRFCGPILEHVVVPLWQEYGNDVEFVHIEPYDLKRAREGVLQPVPVVAEWGLRSEPFIFVVDRDGLISAKFEGIMDEVELRDAIEAVR